MTVVGRCSVATLCTKIREILRASINLAFTCVLKANAGTEKQLLFLLLIHERKFQYRRLHQPVVLCYSTLRFRFFCLPF